MCNITRHHYEEKATPNQQNKPPNKANRTLYPNAIGKDQGPIINTAPIKTAIAVPVN